MNEHKKPRGHKAHNDKDSILADAKNLLLILYPAIQRMPKIERIEGAPVEMKKAAQNIIRHFSIAKYTGLLKNRTSYNRIMQLKATIGEEWWKWLDWDQRRQCIVSKPQYGLRQRLNKKYKLKLKRK